MTTQIIDCEKIISTSFKPFFQEVEKTQNLTLQGVCVYLTGGCGNFPSSISTFPTLWVVVPGGLAKDQFPFGDVVELI
jgi:predicted metal-dependent peptidase